MIQRRSPVKDQKNRKTFSPCQSSVPDTPIGAAIIHTDALLESLRKRSARDITTAPKWLISLNNDERLKLQRYFRQTFKDMKIAARGGDKDICFAYAHFKADALRAACQFFSTFIFDKSLVPTPKVRKKKAVLAKARPKPENKQMTFSDLFSD